MGWFLLIGLPLTTIIAVLLVRERELPPQTHLSLIDSVRAVWRNSFAKRVLGVDLLLGVAQGVAGTLFVFYFEYVLGFERESNLLLFVYFVAGLLGVPIWMYVSKLWGKHRGLQAALVWTAVTTLLIPLMPPGNFAVVALMMALAGSAQGGGVLLTRALVADVVDADELETGSRRSGLYFGLMLTTSKLAIVAGPASLALLQLIGFKADLGGANSPDMLFALSAMFVLGPVVAALAGAWMLQNYPLDEKAQAALHAAIEARHKGEASSVDTAL